MNGNLIHITINGNPYDFLIAHDITGAIPAEETLAETLRERLNLTGTKLHVRKVPVVHVPY